MIQVPHQKYIQEADAEMGEAAGLKTNGGDGMEKAEGMAVEKNRSAFCSVSGNCLDACIMV